MKAILMSIRPKYVADILNGIKMFEIRKKFPKDYVGWVYIYCTKDKKYTLERNLDEPYDFFTLKDKKHLVFKLDKNHCGYNGKVVARFWCDKVDEFYDFDDDLCEQACLDRGEMLNYLGDKKGYAIHITKLEIFNKPKEISEFMKKLDNFDGINCWRCSNRHNCSFNIDKKCEKLKLTRAPQSWCYVEEGD